MAETLTETKTGTANVVKWCTIEESERYEKCINRNYIRKDKSNSKDFFYKIIGMHPSQPATTFKTGEDMVMPGKDSFLINFEVQKYYRNKMTKSVIRDASNPAKKDSVDVHKQVDQHEMRDGNFVLVDPDASFYKDARTFLKEFQVDDTE